MPALKTNLSVAGCALLVMPVLAAAQVPLDRADPAINQRALPATDTDAARSQAAPPASSAIAEVPVALSGTVTPVGIVISGAPDIPPFVFSENIVSYSGRPLEHADLARLASDVAKVAHERGFPFATAVIPPQSMANGVLSVTLDEGKVDAVRVIGASNAAADRILMAALATGKPTRQADLERAILLVGDLPGVTVTQSQFLRHDGFGVLLVTIAQEKQSAYLQIDNRGSKEIGPIRSTLLANVNNVATAGDEVGLLVAQTPLQPREFVFVRARYSLPIDHAGSVLGISGSFGRSNPGASLRDLDVIGKSVDAAISYSRSLRRSRAQSYALNFELRTLRTKQTLFGRQLRDDRLTTLSGSLDGVTAMAGGKLRSQVLIVGGLPLSGVSHEGDKMLSRVDGDARFVTASYSVEWTGKLWRKLSLAAASTGQVASRPLLATMEIGAGGPAYGRAYDYAERTGDQGILGLVELRFDGGKLVPGVIDNFQIFSSVDGGYVDNRREGAGGGSLLSTSGGVRVMTGKLSGALEVSLPLNADRFNTRDRDPRVALRLARLF
ncbi:ShlB/FhaC/HecB family hemolysin secretion/activation protein [Sphingobium sp. SCG-1]|uniref:ShlB/FhaC/HecB family hemolysin secretion/activation protein n=1 Tax=Sphingobium sp. SCG-1 TaxID=2072936 RepID=UPI000CD68F82|nr:ShlB/FhaC/HecB family hemolysin secretion/activation protein [Sphingobium sp. SCG-1]AUW57075.1 ShlB/FhaC/HecB family hemolysin secretion/activation protein [Sphingobium sp. SCG-1]